MPEGALLPDEGPAGEASNIGVLVLKEPTGVRRSTHLSRVVSGMGELKHALFLAVKHSLVFRRISLN